MSSDERLRSATIGADDQTARTEVRSHRVFGRPERSDFPAFNLPNKIGARGFSPGLNTHSYLVPVIAPTTLRGRAGLSAVGAALTENPTPGKDFPATPKGTVNDVGDLLWDDGDDNFVGSYLVPSSRPDRSVTIVNYTIAGEHTMTEGFVMRFAELRADGRIVLITYGEGDAFKMSIPLKPIWGPQVEEAWTANAREIFAAANAGGRQ